MMKRYQVTYACDSLDTNPTIKQFDCHYDMEEWISEQMTSRLDHVVQHSQDTISESEYNDLVDIEWSLIRIENI